MSASRPPRIECGPIELRLITPRSAPQLFALARDPEVSRKLQWPAHERVEDSVAYIHDAQRLWEQRTAFLPGIFERGRSRLVGCTGLSSIDRANRRAEVGTWLGAAYQGCGFNRPAKAAIIQYGFETLQLRRLEFLVRADNERSLRSMRRLPGVREEGLLAERLWFAGRGHDAVLFVLLARDHDPALWPAVEIDRGLA